MIIHDNVITLPMQTVDVDQNYIIHLVGGVKTYPVLIPPVCIREHNQLWDVSMLKQSQCTVKSLLILFSMQWRLQRGERDASD